MAWLVLSALWTLAFALIPYTSPENLTACLARAKVPFLIKDSIEWARETTTYNIRLNYTPAEVATPRSIDEIQVAVLCGIENDFRVSAKGGGHSFGSFGLGGEDGHLVISLGRMRQVMVHDNHIAKVQPGARLLHVATELYRQGRRAIPHGSCLSVGISGLVLHGGFGFASRTYGLTLDWLIGATVVLANGSVVHCSATENQDLFWALRGAGSSFGIVAEFEFNTFEAPRQVTPFDIELSWDETRAVTAIETFQNFALAAPRELNLMLDITPTDKIIKGVYYGSHKQLYKVLRLLLRQSRGKISLTTVGWIESLLEFDEVDPVHPFDSSLVLSISANDISHNNLAVSGSLYLSIEAHGGNNSAVAYIAQNETAYGQRDKLLLFQLFDGGSRGYYPNDGFSRLTTIRESVTSSIADGKWGMYANYVDTEVDAKTAERLYWGGNLRRLKKLKSELDPKQVFRGPQGIQPGKGHLFPVSYDEL
ncbi:hypothetical protein HIM_10886 [Hirsutella minnesotensis 3608]|uniref:FAD-binding PCMH-type domain-containing protein n=1 Tax=Hirsutella minnesotensis 3608 TaxID=1043627 RepID=A0A0F7ZWX2_9HYPO|nr:hypothetical protein HIM_10886 [Hirsutella minnesotensis 3608]